MSTRDRVAQTANAVLEVVRASGLSKKEIAERAEIPYGTLTRKLSGRSEFTLAELFRIAEVTGVTPARFVSFPS
ncbi:MAG: helix-turn-helix domain-containing protein [Microbacterium sp.]